MQLVNTIDFPFEDQLSIGRKIRGFVGAFWQETARIWDRLRNMLPETADLAPHAARTPIGHSGYYGGAYDRLTASMPIVSCVECNGADPFPQAPTSPRGTAAAKQTDPEPRPDGEEGIWRAVLRAHFESPALMI
jgi:hypothetical protein